MNRNTVFLIVFTVATVALVLLGVALMMNGAHYNLFLPVFSAALACVAGAGMHLGKLLGVAS